MTPLFGTPPSVRFERKKYNHIDRGLARPAVRAYAKAQKITYEDAHQILSEMNSVTPGATVAPDKWELSRKDSKYKKAQCERAKAQYWATRNRFATV